MCNPFRVDRDHAQNPRAMPWAILCNPFGVDVTARPSQGQAVWGNVLRLIEACKKVR